MDLFNGTICPTCGDAAFIKFDSFEYKQLNEKETLMIYNYHCEKCEMRWAQRALIRNLGTEVKHQSNEPGVKTGRIELDDIRSGQGLKHLNTIIDSNKPLPSGIRKDSLNDCNK